MGSRGSRGYRYRSRSNFVAFATEWERKSRRPKIRGCQLIIRAQSILYHTPIASITRAIEYLDNAARIARRAGIVQGVVIAYGDCSPQPLITIDDLTDLKRRFSNLTDIEYNFFDRNHGHGGGQNRLLEDAASDLLMIVNPDVLVSPTAFIELVSALGRAGVGLVEARQLPIEHQKEYDPQTGETNWASGACAMGPMDLFRDLGGFDSDSFFLHCDDVDFSWRVRLAGFEIVHQTSAIAFHDKRLTNTASRVANPTERYYSAEGTLLLSYKYSRPDLTKIYLRNFDASGDEDHIKAASAFRLREKSGRLPTPIDNDHAVAKFVNLRLGPWRFLPR